MKRLLLLGLLGTGCLNWPDKPPVIESFAVDDPSPMLPASVHLTFSVRDAAVILILPEPGYVNPTSSPVTVQPGRTTTYILQAGNSRGFVRQELVVTPRTPPGPAYVQRFSVLPAQATAGTTRTLSWRIRDGVKMTLSGGGIAPVEVNSDGEVTDAPAATTTYTLTATSNPGVTPDAATAHAVARVVDPPAITSFTATPAAVLQGDPVMLRWQGTALDWSLASGGTTTYLGNSTGLVVRPSATTTYALTGRGPGGTAGPQALTVEVTPRAGTTLTYTAPSMTTQPLQLVADACPAPCTALTLRLVAAAPLVLRGAALDLPADSTKVSLDPATFGSALDAGSAVLGAGPLQDTLVLGAALEGTGSGPASDRALASGAELAHFTVALQPAGGQGIVFDGAAAYQAFIQSASGRTPGGIAVGRLEAR